MRLNIININNPCYLGKLMVMGSRRNRFRFISKIVWAVLLRHICSTAQVHFHMQRAHHHYFISGHHHAKIFRSEK